ncbi:MAG TPA: LysR family transcriptional regulator [Thermoleophilaceae bacterium]|nr:LysR family transcriptional regulator [Thermoleophilaceae bacterium]
MATRPPDINELRTFCVAADSGSLGRAALRLGVSQPALSKRLASLETLAGTQLLERSSKGVKLTPAGRRLYEEARNLLTGVDKLEEVLLGLRRSGGPVRLAASHSATEAIVSDLLGELGGEQPLPVELATANSSVVRDLVADGRADLGVTASRPQHTPYPGVREELLLADEVVCAVPLAHPWARRRSISIREFLNTPMVVRDPSSNARWTVDAALREQGLMAAPPLVEAGTPQAALREAQARKAPVLLSRYVIRTPDFVQLRVDGISFPRSYVLLLPAYGEPTQAVARLAARLREHAEQLRASAREEEPAR